MKYVPKFYAGYPKMKCKVSQNIKQSVPKFVSQSIMQSVPKLNAVCSTLWCRMSPNIMCEVPKYYEGCPKSFRVFQNDIHSVPNNTGCLKMVERCPQYNVGCPKILFRVSQIIQGVPNLQCRVCSLFHVD